MVMAPYSAVTWLYLLLGTASTVTGQASCTDGIPSVSELIAPSRPTVALPVLQPGNNVQQWIFPGLRFSCSGNLTSWIFRAENSSSEFATNRRPRFEVWFENENTDAMDFNRRHEASEDLELLRYDSPDDPVYEYRLPAPIVVVENDLLGLYFPAVGRFESLRMLFLDMGEGNASTSYRRNVNNEIFPIQSSFVSTDNAHVPLVSAVFGLPEGSTTVAISPTSTSMNPPASTSSSVPTSSPTVTEPPPTRTSSATSIGLIVGIVAAVLFVILLAVVASIAIMCIMMRQRRKNQYTATAIMSNGQLDNPVYGGAEPQAVDKNHRPVSYHLYALPTQVVSPAQLPSPNGVNSMDETIADHYEFSDEVLPNGLGTESHYEMEPYAEATVPATALPGQYEVPLSALSNYRSEELDSPKNHEYSVLDQGIYVPTEEERRVLGSSTPQTGVFDDNIYSRWSKKYKSRIKDGMYFQEETVYWKPASDKNALYDQLARRKYREILRDQIHIIEHLGAGQFGTVNKGLWQSHYGTEQVAIKTLQPNASETDKVKFLQEAAIMGQFLHPNVVKLHGVVTVGEPVMIVIEYMPKGDLRNYLRARAPQPGEMAPVDLPSLLLKFCREIASGMNYLSNKAFVHRDLAARNILVAEDNTCKIGDFGMSRDLEDNNYYITHGGKIPVKWTAPEALNYRKYSTASDVWSFGAVMYEIWSLGHKPFEGYTNHQVFQLLATGFRLPPPPGCPRPMYGLMIRCWHSEATVRPMFSAVVNMLSHSDSHLLSWTVTDRKASSKAISLGAPLQAGGELYQDLQDYYVDKK